MSYAIIMTFMTYINIAKFALITELEKDHSVIETRRFKNVVIFNQTKYKNISFNGCLLLKCSFFTYLSTVSQCCS